MWVKLTSSRIWRGSNAGNTWTYSGRGSWKPKGGRSGKSKAVKGKGKSRKRKMAEENEGTKLAYVLPQLSTPSARNCCSGSLLDNEHI